MMLTEICQYLRNWFTRHQYYGKFTIAGGVLQTQYDNGAEYSNIAVVSGQYVRIIGSALNDGVHKFPTSGLTDETFDGAVWKMSVPAAVLSIVQDIEAWQTKYNSTDSGMLSPFTSESFGGYSYSKANGAESAAGGVSWKSVFGSRLDPWRMI